MRFLNAPLPTRRQSGKLGRMWSPFVTFLGPANGSLIISGLTEAVMGADGRVTVKRIQKKGEVVVLEFDAEGRPKRPS